MRTVVQAGNVVVLDEENPRIRNNRDHHGHVGVFQ